MLATILQPMLYNSNYKRSNSHKDLKCDFTLLSPGGIGALISWLEIIKPMLCIRLRQSLLLSPNTDFNHEFASVCTHHK